MEKKRSDCPCLPPGWKKEEVIRKSGLSAGKTDVYYYSPSGKKFRSKPQLARYLGNSIDLNSFDFRTGKMMPNKLQRNKQRLRNEAINQIKGKPDLNTSLPIRQTASIFKQPVTKVTDHPNNKVKSELQRVLEQPRQCDVPTDTWESLAQDHAKWRNSIREGAEHLLSRRREHAKTKRRQRKECAANQAPRPLFPPTTVCPRDCLSFPQWTVQRTENSLLEWKQVFLDFEGLPMMMLFWEKRLQGLSACDIAEQIIESMELPKGLQVIGPGNTNEALLSAIASALHTSSGPITGQPSAAVEKNPAVWLNTYQPMCRAFVVTDKDIRKQEERVQQVRKKLEEALMADELARAEEVTEERRGTRAM